mgnify:CR=1 FL=1
MFMTDMDQVRIVRMLQCENSGKIPKAVEEQYGLYRTAWAREGMTGDLPMPILMNICVATVPEQLKPKKLVVELPSQRADPAPVEPDVLSGGHPITYESPTEGIMTGRFIEKTKNGMFKVSFGESGVRVISPKNAHVPSLSAPDPHVHQVI